MWSRILKDSVHSYIYRNGSRKKSKVMLSSNARGVNAVLDTQGWSTDRT